MSDSRSLINNMTEGSIIKHLILFSLPFMGASLLQTLYGTVDMMVVGNFSGQVEMAAVSVGGQLNNLFTYFGIGFAGAAQIIIAQLVGKRDHAQIEKTIGTAFATLGGLAILLGAICLIFCVPMLNLLNTPDEAFHSAAQYMRVCGCGMLFIYGYNVVSAILRGMGDSKRPLYFIAVAAVVNILLDLLLVAVFHMGAFGAAIATVAGQAVSFLWSLFYLYRNRERLGFELHFRDLNPDRKLLFQIVRIGLPMALQHSAIGLSAMVLSSFINTYGVAATAITGVGQKLSGLVCLMSNALYTASATLVGQNVAARKYDRVRQLIWGGFVLSVGTSAVLGLICVLFPHFVVGIFNSDPELMAYAPYYMKIMFVAFLSGASMGPFYALVNGIGYASLSLVIGIMDGVVARIGLALLLGFGLKMGIYGFWWGDALAGYVTTILSAAYYFTGKWKTYQLPVDR